MVSYYNTTVMSRAVRRLSLSLSLRPEIGSHPKTFPRASPADDRRRRNTCGAYRRRRSLPTTRPRVYITRNSSRTVYAGCNRSVFDEECNDFYFIRRFRLVRFFFLLFFFLITITYTTAYWFYEKSNFSTVFFSTIINNNSIRITMSLWEGIHFFFFLKMHMLV